MKHQVDLNTWERVDNWRFMSGFTNSWYSVTSEVDVTHTWTQCHAQGRSFFLCYLYAMLRASNEVRAFGYRPDGKGGVVWFDNVGATVPIDVPGRTFYTVLIPYIENYDDFVDNATRIIRSIPEDGDPYGVNRQLIDSGETGVVNISATPKLYFTSMTYTFHKPGLGSDWPLMNAGKMVEREGKKVMPMAVYVDHSFVDGADLALFFEKVQHYLDKTL